MLCIIFTISYCSLHFRIFYLTIYTFFSGVPVANICICYYLFSTIKHNSRFFSLYYQHCSRHYNSEITNIMYAWERKRNLSRSQILPRANTKIRKRTGIKRSRSSDDNSGNSLQQTRWARGYPGLAHVNTREFARHRCREEKSYLCKLGGQE